MREIAIAKPNIESSLNIINTFRSPFNIKSEYSRLSGQLVFPLAKNIEDANQWAKNNINIEHLDFCEFDINVANIFNRELYIAQAIFPQALEEIKWISTTQRYLAHIKQTPQWETWVKQVINANIDSDFKRHILSAYSEKDLEYAQAYSEIQERFIKGVTFNKIWVNNYNKLLASIEENVLTGFFPKGTARMESLIWHEFGHFIRNFLRSNKINDSVDKIYQDYFVNEKTPLVKISEDLSEYASYSEEEFFAEAITEYITSKNPRETSIKVGTETSKALCLFKNTK